MHADWVFCPFCRTERLEIQSIRKRERKKKPPSNLPIHQRGYKSGNQKLDYKGRGKGVIMNASRGIIDCIRTHEKVRSAFSVQQDEKRSPFLV